MIGKLRNVSLLIVFKTTVQRHRMIYAALSDELAAGLHALSLTTKTPAEVEKKVGTP